ncbi:glycosyltransferase [Halobacteroides halobius DSM 5150]|uniref:Glycosyltransferase n=1 Tax=Halobacteroides halobius (strain ATCC 35273 / DSM 5150 / MD-1) TaxID=748449 RepID=L0KCH8_HALHC|nr:glycosyltransferase [Halobacteroides halobius]AGB42255.1 glycosyltransferase [Halobacteroides halobius DSM 5150]
MNVLYVTPRPPHSPYKGDQLIAYNQIKRLENKCKLNLITFIETQKQKKEVHNEFAEYCENIFFIKLSRSKKINILKTLINYKPFQVNMFKESRAKEKIEDIINSVDPDLIHVQTIRLAEYFLDTNLPKVIDMIDAISLNMKRRSKKDSFLLKLPFYLESYLCEKYEDKILDEFNQVLLISKKDKEYLKDSDKIKINPNGTYIDQDFLSNYNNIKKEKALVFHGNMQYFPNVEAVNYFTKEIFPKLKNEYKDLKFYIVGKDPTEKVEKLANKEGVIVTGFVDDICGYLIKSLVGVYSLRSGTGMQNKILEALGCGLPSVVSPLALQGIQNTNDSHVCIARNKEEFIEKISILIENEQLRKSIAKRGQEFILNNYTWEANVNRLLKSWKNTLND